MTHWIAWTFLRSAGWPRAALLAGTTALATALLLIALTMLLLPGAPVEALFSLVAEPGLRWGTAFATALLVLPLLLMLNQVVRLGTATRERRLAALRQPHRRRYAGSAPSKWASRWPWAPWRGRWCSRCCGRSSAANASSQDRACTLSTSP